MPAEQESSDIQGVHRLCGACCAKRQLINNFYQNVKRTWEPWLPIDRVRVDSEWPQFILADLLVEVQHASGAGVETLSPQDIGQIGQRSRPSNYIGFIYADGNRMGDIVKRIGEQTNSDHEARQAYAAFSQIVDLATRRAAVRSVLKFTPSDGEIDDGNVLRFVPAEFAIAGADDLVLIVPGSSAIETTAHFLRLFQQLTIELQEIWVRCGCLRQPFEPLGLTMSAGVVIAHAAYPASQLFDLAFDLMKQAKHKAADLDRVGTSTGTLDFMVLHESGSEPAKARRKREYMRKHGNKTAELTERPYTESDAIALLECIRGLKFSDTPRTALKSLYPALFQSPPQAQFDCLRVLSRLSSSGALGTESPLSTLVGGLDLFPFRRRASGDLTTPLTEIVELYDFVHGEV